MRTIYTNGTIYTENQANDRVDTVAIQDGRFTFVGKAADLQPAEGDEVVDLQGKCVLPGLIDSHQHWTVPAFSGGPHANACPMLYAPTINELLEQVAAFVNRYPDYEFYKCVVGKKEDWERPLTRHDLDKVCPGKPLLAHDAGAHSCTANTTLLERMGITRDTPDPAPGYSFYGRDENGELTGLATEWAQLAFHSQVDTVSHEDMVANVRELIEYNASRGITGAYDAGVLSREDEFLDALKALDDAGELKCRLSVSHAVTLPHLLDGAVARQLEIKARYESDNIKMDTLKIFVDGTTGEYSGFLSKPYKGKDFAGAPMLSPEQMYVLFKQVNEAGLNIHMHVIGDASAAMILDTLDRMEAEGIELKVKFVIAHLQLIRDEYLPKLAKHGVYLNLTPHWVGNLAVPVLDTFTLPDELSGMNYRYQTYWSTGVNVAFSCDCTILPSMIGDAAWNPWHGMQIGATRLAIGDTDERLVDDPGERLTIEQLVQGYTINGAKQCSWEAEAGSIEVGKSADLVVVDADPFQSPVHQVHAIEPELVLFKGKPVYERGATR